MTLRSCGRINHDQSKKSEVGIQMPDKGYKKYIVNIYENLLKNIKNIVLKY